MSELLEAFRVGYAASQEAFNRHDFETAFAVLPEDVIWETLDDIPGARPMHGKAEVVAFFREVIEDWRDYRTELLDITEPEPGLIHIRFKALATGPLSGVPTETTVIQAWDFRTEPLRIRETPA